MCIFDAPLTAGLRYREECISKADEEALIVPLSAMDLPPLRFQGWLGNRKTTSFGWPYDFDDSNFLRGDPLAHAEVRVFPLGRGPRRLGAPHRSKLEGKRIIVIARPAEAQN